MKEMQTTHDQMKALIAMDILCAYYTNASDYQLASCIMQEGQSVVY
jgi:hypothetical protein